MMKNLSTHINQEQSGAYAKSKTSEKDLDLVITVQNMEQENAQVGKQFYSFL
jgi:hypothetical protein